MSSPADEADTARPAMVDDPAVESDDMSDDWAGDVGEASPDLNLAAKSAGEGGAPPWPGSPRPFDLSLDRGSGGEESAFFSAATAAAADGDATPAFLPPPTPNSPDIGRRGDPDDADVEGMERIDDPPPPPPPAAAASEAPDEAPAGGGWVERASTASSNRTSAAARLT